MNIADTINALPEPVRKYIAALETECDPTGTIRENYRLREENAGLRAECERLSGLPPLQARKCILSGGCIDPKDCTGRCAEANRQDTRATFQRLGHSIAAAPGGCVRTEGCNDIRCGVATGCAAKQPLQAWEEMMDHPYEETIARLIKIHCRASDVGNDEVTGEYAAASAIVDALLSSTAGQEWRDDTADIRWAINVLLEKIAAKFEANDTWDIWKSDAAAVVRSFKHELPVPPVAEPVS